MCKRKQTLSIILVSLFAWASYAAAFPLKVDIGASGQPVKPGWQEFSAGHQVGPQYQTYDVDGTTIGVDIRIGNDHDAGYRNYGGGVLGGDMAYPDDDDYHGPVDGSIIMTLSNIPAGSYSVTSYHNDSKSGHSEHGPINVTVSGAVSVSEDDLNVPQTRNFDNDDDLGQSYVTFAAGGGGDVIITYAPIDDAAPDARACLNGFELDLAGPAIPRVQFDTTASADLESESPVALSVILSTSTAETVTVDYTVTGGTAQAGVDYTLADGTLTFAPDQTTPEYIYIEIIDDGTPEDDETIIVTLSAPTNANLGTNTQHIYTILDPYPHVGFDTATGQGREDVTPVDIPVSLSVSWPNAVTVDYAVTGGTATGGADYILADGTLSFAPGQTSPEYISIDVIDDGTAEDDETIVITLSNPVNAKLGTITEYTYSIIDVTTSVAFDSAAAQGWEDVTPVNIPVSLSEASNMTVTVDYDVTGGTASSGGDYVLANGTLSFAPGQMTPEYINIEIVDDGIPENDETVIITLSNPGNAKLGTNTQHTFTILDTTPAVGFDSAASQGFEDLTPRPAIPVSLSQASAVGVIVDYAVTGGTAAAGQDYTLANGTLTFAANQTGPEYINIVVADDGVAENDETIIITLSDPSNAKLGNITEHTYTIQDPPDRPCPIGDLNSDCEVDYYDLGILVDHWLTADAGSANLDGVKAVDGIDYSLLARNIFKTGYRVIINEFLASNSFGYDWIELYNPTPISIDLGGMFLTDNLNDTTKYPIPDGISIGPNQYRIFWASEYPDMGDFYTNFRLDSGGEQVGLFGKDGTSVIDSIDFDDLPQATDISYGRDPDEPEIWRYLANPTPEALNDGAYDGAVADTKFSDDRGFYDTAFDLVITCETPGATIRYTEDGSKPTESHGQIYSSPIHISSTRCVRAMAYKTGWFSTNIDAQTYLFGADAARKAIPTLSMAGISGRDGVISLELIYADEFLQARGVDWKGFQTDCVSAAHSGAGHRLKWQHVSGEPHLEAHLDYPFFEAAPVAAEQTTNRFDRIVLRGGKNSPTTYLGDPWVQVSEKVMAGFGCNSMFMHLYKNGNYVGVTNPKERPDAWSWSSYYGGEFEDYFTLNQNFEPGRGNKILSGDRSRFDQMMSMGGLNNLSNYNQFKTLCDVSHFADYTILFWYSGFGDGCDNNYYGGMRNNPLNGEVPPEGYKMVMWDGEMCFTNNGGPPGHETPWVPDYYDDTGAVIPHIWNKLRESSEFMMLFADRIYKHFYNDGALTDENSRARWDALLAAGGSGNVNFSGFRDIFMGAVGGYYPNINPPDFQHGGEVDTGYSLTMTGSGTIYYTLDGSDPRQPGGSVSGSAVTYSGPITLNESTIVKARAKSGEWSALHEATFSVGHIKENLRINEIMYHPSDPTPPELAAGFTNDGVFEFLELQNISDTDSINLALVKFTNGIDFMFDSVPLGPGEYVVLVKDQAAFEFRYGPGINVAGEYTGNLNNGGERIEVEDAIGQTILNFRYEDGWYDITDGGGFSLTIKDPANTDPNDWDQKSSWRPSAAAGGSPGEDDTGQLPELGSIKINELLAHSHLEPDWIELHNTTGDTINIGGWFLSDSGSDLTRYEIPLDAPQASIPAGGYVVFYEDQHFGNVSAPGCHTPFAMTENGETVYLHSGQGGVLTGYSEEEKFGASESNVAFGRYYKASTDSYNFVAMSQNTPGLLNADPKVGPIVINEIMYNPPAGGSYDHDEYEYIELYNITGGLVNLYRVYPDEGGIQVSWQFTDGIDYVFPADTTIGAGEYIVVAKNLAAFAERYPSVPSGIVYGPFLDGTKLSNGGEKVDFSMPGDVDGVGQRQYIRIDRVNYSDGSHPVGDDPWPTEPDGTGKSLSRIAAADYGNDVANWQAATHSPGATNP